MKGKSYGKVVYNGLVQNSLFGLRYEGIVVKECKSVSAQVANYSELDQHKEEVNL